MAAPGEDLVRRPTLRDHLTCGRHSGFPSCCTVFFSLWWVPLRRVAGSSPTAARLARLYLRAVNHMRSRRTGFSGWGRLPCPLCLLRLNPTTPVACGCWGRGRAGEGNAASAEGADREPGTGDCA